MVPLYERLGSSATEASTHQACRTAGCSRTAAPKAARPAEVGRGDLAAFDARDQRRVGFCRSLPGSTQQREVLIARFAVELELLSVLCHERTRWHHPTARLCDALTQQLLDAFWLSL